MEDYEDVNYSAGSDYFLKCHDGAIDGTIELSGDFSKSYDYALKLLNDLYFNSNATSLIEPIYENNKKILLYHVCAKVIPPDYSGMANPDEASLCLPSGYYYTTIKLNDNYDGDLRDYNLLSYNCVQVSMEVLLNGSFSEEYQIYYNRLDEISGNFFELDMWPNIMYMMN